jgi:WD40 repeat protein
MRGGRMKRTVKLVLIVLFAFMALRATCGKVKPEIKTPVEVDKFIDFVYFHNVSIAFDGNHYFTINGGNAEYCKLNEYDKAGKFVRSYDMGLDARAIFYHPDKKKLYVKIFGFDLYEVNLEEESAKKVLDFAFKSDNSSPAFSPDGKTIYELVDGTIWIINFDTGKQEGDLAIPEYYAEHGYSMSIAASGDFLFVWASDDEVYVYDFKGKKVSQIQMPIYAFGFSLSYCNDRLWGAVDADAWIEGDYGHWYGYDLTGKHATRGMGTKEDSATPK